MATDRTEVSDEPVAPAVLDAESKALARPARSLVTSQDELTALANQARAIANTRLVPEGYRGKPDEVLACALVAKELGIGLMYALQHVFITPEGKQGMSVALMQTLARRDGLSIRPITTTDVKCVVWGKRRDNRDEAMVEWTIEDARRAKLAGKPSWEKYPRSMLFSRAVAQLIRELQPESLSGIIYTPEELADAAAADFEVAFEAARGKVSRPRTGDRQERAEGAGDDPERFLSQSERDALKAAAGGAPELKELSKQAFEELGRDALPEEPYRLVDLQVKHERWIRIQISRRNRGQDPDDENGERPAPASEEPEA